MAGDPESRPIQEYAFELVPDDESQLVILRQFGISPDASTRMGWQRKFQVDHFRNGLVDTWPNYLHASLLFVIPPHGIANAGDLRTLVRNPIIQEAVMEGLPDSPLEMQFYEKPFETRRGAFLLIPDRDGSADAIHKVDLLQHRLKETICRSGLGEVRDECASDHLHLTVRGAWVQGGQRAQENFEQHVLQCGMRSRKFTLRFDRVAVTPWPTDRSDKRNQFYTGWAAWWFLGQGSHADGKGRKGYGKGKKGKGKGNGKGKKGEEEFVIIRPGKGKANGKGQ